ncbi:MAG: 50S ribosomal protein L10 [Nitrospirae bacterium]|nr:50S ribosomal protein L10 [Nitrospirota bacterium]
MTRTEKQQIVESYRDRFQKAQAVLLAEFKGIKVSEAVELRRTVRRVRGEYKVLKNTLIGRALGEGGLTSLASQLNGTTAVILANGDPVPLTKAVMEFGKKCATLRLKGAYVGGRSLSMEEVKQLADLPGRDLLLSQVVGAIRAPLLNLVGVLQAGPTKLLLVLRSLEQKRQAGASGGA